MTHNHYTVIYMTHNHCTDIYMTHNHFTITCCSPLPSTQTNWSSTSALWMAFMHIGFMPFFSYKPENL